MARLPSTELEAARKAAPGDVWYSRTTGKPVEVVEQMGKLHIVIKAANGSSYYLMHFKFTDRYRRFKPEQS